jgi:hypothetical protein
LAETGPQKGTLYFYGKSVLGCSRGWLEKIAWGAFCPFIKASILGQKLDQKRKQTKNGNLAKCQSSRFYLF